MVLGEFCLTFLTAAAVLARAVVVVLDLVVLVLAVLVVLAHTAYQVHQALHLGHLYDLDLLQDHPVAPLLIPQSVSA